MTNTNFEGWHVIAYDGGEAVLCTVVGQLVRDGTLWLVARHPEKRSCEFIEADVYIDGDLYAPGDRDAGEARVAAILAGYKAAEDGNATDEAA